AADLHGRVERHRDRRKGLHEEVTVSRGEMQKLEQDIARLDAAWREAQTQAATADAEVERLHARLHQAEDEIHRLDQQRQDRQSACTHAQVALATMEERLRALRNQHQQLDRDWQQRQQEQTQTSQGQTTCKQRLLESQRTMLDASAALARVFLDKEATQARVAEMVVQRDGKRLERGRLGQLAQNMRAEWRTQQEQFHSRELAVNDLRHQRDSLVDRLREDYQVELGELYRDSLNRAAQPAVETDAPETKTPPLDPAA